MPTIEPTPEDVKTLLAIAEAPDRSGYTYAPSVVAGLCRRLLAAEAEVAGLRNLADSLAERVARQAELLAKKAEKPPVTSRPAAEYRCTHCTHEGARERFAAGSEIDPRLVCPICFHHAEQVEKGA